MVQLKRLGQTLGSQRLVQSLADFLPFTETFENFNPFIGGGLLFSDDFTSGITADWDNTLNTNIVAFDDTPGNNLLQDCIKFPNALAGDIIFLTPAAFTPIADMTVTVESYKEGVGADGDTMGLTGIRVKQADGGGFLKGDGYYFGMERVASSRFFIFKRVNGVVTALTPTPFGNRPGTLQVFKVMVRIKGSRIDVYAKFTGPDADVFGNQVAQIASYTDTSITGTGSVGFAKFITTNDNNSYISNLEVRDADEVIPSVEFWNRNLGPCYMSDDDADNENITGRNILRTGRDTIFSGLSEIHIFDSDLSQENIRGELRFFPDQVAINDTNPFLILRRKPNGDMYLASWTRIASAQGRIHKRVSGLYTQIAATGGLAVIAGSVIRLEFEVNGAAQNLKAFDQNTETERMDISASDAAISGEGSAGLGDLLTTGTPGRLPAVHKLDLFAL